MKELKFDLHAMTAPKGPEAVLALLREFQAEVAIVDEHLDKVRAYCEAATDKKA